MDGPLLRRQRSTGSIRKGRRDDGDSDGSGGSSSEGVFRRNLSLDNRFKRAGKMVTAANRFRFGRQSSMDPNNKRARSQSPPPRGGAPPPGQDGLSVPENLDTTMQLLFLACQGDTAGVEALLDSGVDVNSIDLDGRTALHIAACEGKVEVARLLLSRKANIDARDRWGSTAAADAKYYGNTDVFNLLRAKGAKIPRSRKTPMAVSNPSDIPEYELNPCELQFRRGEEILKGRYQVAKWNGTKVSVKILDKESVLDQETVNAFKHELTILEKVRHPNVLQFVGAVTQNIPMMIVLEYHAKGDLQSYIHKKGKLGAQKALKFALDIARGMNYLHQCRPDPVIHCELKPKNILLDYGGQLKVSGFGLTRLVNAGGDKFQLAKYASAKESFSQYTAPEIYRNEPFDLSVDAFSFGVVLYEVIEGGPVFGPKSSKDALHMMCAEGLRPPLKNKMKSYPSDLKELIEECWDPQPAVRPTFAEIIIRLDKIYALCAKQGRWKDNFKLPWK